jgi:hypothetical protein
MAYLVLDIVESISSIISERSDNLLVHLGFSLVSNGFGVQKPDYLADFLTVLLRCETADAKERHIEQVAPTVCSKLAILVSALARVWGIPCEGLKNCVSPSLSRMD